MVAVAESSRPQSAIVVPSPASARKSLKLRVNEKARVATNPITNPLEAAFVSRSSRNEAWIGPSLFESLKAAILGRSIEGLRDYEVSSFAAPAVTQPPAAAFEPSSDWFVTPIVPPVDSDHTVMRPASMSPVAATQTAKRKLALSMSDGRRFELTARMLIGRDPAPREGDDGASLVKLDDDAVSKTHAAFGRQGDSVWVEDRGSTNGSVLVDESGRHVALLPGQRVLLTPPATVVIGDTTISAIWL